MFSIRSVEAALVRRREWTLLRRLQKTHGQRLHEHARERAFGTRHTATRTSAAHAAQLAMAFLPPPTQLDMSEAEAIFDLIDKSHLSLGAGEIQDGRLDEQDCRGLARAMKLDEDRFWRLLKRHGEQEGDGRVTFAEWIAAIEKSFLMNKCTGQGSIDINRAMREAYIEMNKDNYRGMCTITWKGGCPGLNVNYWTPVIEDWVCFDPVKSQIKLVYRKDERGLQTAVVRVENLNEHCPSNPRAKSCTWDELKETLMVGKVTEVDIIECSY